MLENTSVLDYLNPGFTWRFAATLAGFTFARTLFRKCPVFWAPGVLGHMLILGLTYSSINGAGELIFNISYYSLFALAVIFATIPMYPRIWYLVLAEFLMGILETWVGVLVQALERIPLFIFALAIIDIGLWWYCVKTVTDESGASSHGNGERLLEKNAPSEKQPLKQVIEIA